MARPAEAGSVKLDALDHPKTFDFAARRRAWRYPDEVHMDLERYPVLPMHMRVARLPADAWRALKSIVHDLSGGMCRYCMRSAESFPVCDHIIPLVRGGDNSFENLATACSDCNASKGMLTAEEFDKKRGGEWHGYAQ